MALQLGRQEFRNWDPQTLTFLSALAFIYLQQERLENAEKTFVKVFSLQQFKLGKGDQVTLDTLDPLFNMTSTYMAQDLRTEELRLPQRTDRLNDPRLREEASQHARTLGSPGLFCKPSRKGPGVPARGGKTLSFCSAQNTRAIRPKAHFHVQ